MGERIAIGGSAGLTLDPASLLGGNPYMDIPKFKTIAKGTPIKIKGPRGIFNLFTFKTRRGNGQQKYHLEIQGMIPEEMQFSDQCYVFYDGAELGGDFSECRRTSDGNSWYGTFQTIIPTPSFWE